MSENENDNVFRVFSSDEDENEGGFTSQGFRTTNFFGKQTTDSTDSGFKRLRLSPDDDSHNQEIGSADGGSSSSGGSSPLGLKLTKTRSFLNLLSNRLSKGTGKQERSQQNRGLSHHKTKPKPTHDKERLKAANFPAAYIKIGNWERTPRHEADLTAKVYYAKHKLVWEVLDGPLKSKIEVQWSDIVAIRAVMQENQPGILEIELERPPLFYRETSPQPRKHTLWQHTSDFTGGQATIWRRHYVRFPPGMLDKYYEKLLEIDPRLNAVSMKPYPSKASPYFDTTMFGTSLSFELRHPHSTPTRGPFSVTPNPSLPAFDVPYVYGGGNYQFGTQMQASFDESMNVPRNNYAYQSPVYVVQPVLNAAGSAMETNLWNNSQLVFSDQETCLGNVGSTCSFSNNNTNYHSEMAYHVPQGEQVMQNMAMSSNYGLHDSMVSDTVNWLAVTQEMTNSYPPFVPVTSTSASTGSCFSLEFNDQNI